MNILFVGPYRQNDGWGYATKDYIKALNTNSSYNITTQPVYLGSPSNNFDDSLIENLENKRLDKYDCVIQKTLPECFFLNKTFKLNIGITELETNNFISSSMISSINRMDQIWVPSHIEKTTLQQSGVKIPIRVISQPLDVEYIRSLSEYKLSIAPILKNFFKFYFIGDYSSRKNLLDLVRAFHLAFSYEERVCLVIKTSKAGLKPYAMKELVEKDIEQCKKELNISTKYKKEIIITENLSYKDVIGLHNSCDCFVMPSYGEAFCRPAAEALICGKTPIVNVNTGMKDYINESNGFYIKSHQVPVLIKDRPLSVAFDAYTGNEHWYQIDIYSLVNQLKHVYETRNSEELKKKQETGKNQHGLFSYQTIGSKLCI